MEMKLSIIIPVYNEEENIPKLIPHLKQSILDNDAEIIVVDGGSSDRTVELIQSYDIPCIHCEVKGRAAQMNMGSRYAGGDVYYFVHADALPPRSFISDIKRSMSEGHDAGCYRFRFDSDHMLLKMNSYFTRFDRLMCRGGDQTLFVKKSIFNELGGFREDFLIMEDFEMIDRLRKGYKFRIMPDEVIVSARKYQENHYLKVNFINLVIFTMYMFGAAQATMLHAYRQLIHNTRF